MKQTYKNTLLFLGIYLVAWFNSIFLLFAWTSFGGKNSMNAFQWAVYYFFTFPSNLFGKGFWGIISVPVFWSLIFFVVASLYSQLKK